MRVLIADDDRVLSRMIGAEFKKRGWEVVQAFDAMQAVMFANREPKPDAVVLDLGMPGGTGYGVLEKLGRSARTWDIPVVVVTGSQDEDAQERATQLGAIRFVSKPVDPRAVAEDVEAVTA